MPAVAIATEPAHLPPGDAADAAMERYAAGETAAFAELYDALAPRLLGYLQRQVRDPARAEDLTQQTFLHIHRARGSYLRGARVLPWAFAIARRLMIDGHRRGVHESRWAAANRGPTAPALESGPDELVQARELAGRLLAGVQALPEPQRAAFELVRQEGLTTADAAAVLGISANAVKPRVHRACEALRGLVGEAGEGEVA